MLPTLAQKRRATLTFVLLCIMAFIMYIDRSNLAVAAPTISKELGFSNTHLGLMFSAFALAYSCFMVPGGWLSDRIGSRKAMLVYGVIWSVATIATGLVSGLVALVVARFVVGVGEAPIYPTAARMIARVIPITQRGTAQGVMHASGRMANALAPLIVTFLILQFSWRLSFLILGLATLAFMFVMYFMLSETKKEVDAVVADPVPVFVGKPVHWPTMLRRVWPAAATCFCHGWVLWFFLNWIPSFFTQRYGMDLTKTAIFSTVVLLGGTVGTAVGGMLSDWRFKVTGNRLRSRRDLIIFGFLSSIIGLIPLMFTQDIMICAASLSFSFFCSELADSPLWVIGTEISYEHSATSSACTFFGMAVAGAVSPVVIGWLLDITGNNWAAAFSASIIVVLLGPILAMFIKLDEEPHPEVAEPEPVRRVATHP
ncbi:MFS transporter [Pseudomonas sp. NA-150]|uniref:MFS transporter n=1 Tax=Pseudomonas sp. NA-150 TaxID=3367525 RepID=UPI0037C9F899